MPVIISIFAIALSAFTFYWTALRNRKSFVFIRLSEISAREKFEFALVNGGKTDVLMTRITGKFENKAEKSAFYPEQRVTIKESSGMLVPAGKAIRCIVEFTEPFTSSFVLTSPEDETKGRLHVHPLSVEIEWIEMNGTLHERTIPHSDVGFGSDTKIRMIAPARQATSLYGSGP
jgi:hypothetical protein